MLLAYLATGASVAGGALYCATVLCQQFLHWSPPAASATSSARYSFDVYNLTNTTSFEIPQNDVNQSQAFNNVPDAIGSGSGDILRRRRRPITARPMPVD